MKLDIVSVMILDHGIITEIMLVCFLLVIDKFLVRTLMLTTYGIYVCIAQQYHNYTTWKLLSCHEQIFT